MTSAQLREWAADGRLRPEHEVWITGGPRRAAGEVKGLFAPVAAAAPAGSSPAKPSGHDVFIAHASVDKAVAAAVCAGLEQGPLACWLAPRDVRPGNDYTDELMDAINGSRLIVVVLSAASNSSQHVKREVERGVSKRIPIVPFRIEDVKPTKGMEYLLSSPHWLDALTRPLDPHVARLREVVESALRGDAPPMPSGRGRPQRGTRRFFGRRTVLAAGGLCVLACLAIVMVIALRPRTPDKGAEEKTAAVRPALGRTPDKQLEGSRPEKDYEEYKTAVRTGRGSAAYLHRAAPTRYADWLRRAGAGDAVAQLFIGRCRQEGLIDPEDKKAAIAWLEKSASQGNEYAMVSLGSAHEHGQGVPRDRVAAREWYDQAAARGNTSGMISLGHLSAKDFPGGAPDHETAFGWYRKAADAGDPVGMRQVAECYRLGRGVPPDNDETAKWQRRAAAAGEPHCLGALLEQRLGPALRKYLEAGPGPGRREALRDINLCLPEFRSLDLIGMVAVLGSEDYWSLMDDDRIAGNDPLRAVYGEILAAFEAAYRRAARSEREANLAVFSACTEGPLAQCHEAGDHEQVVRFWEANYKDVRPAAVLEAKEEQYALRQFGWCVAALLRTGRHQEGKALLDASVAASVELLQQKPWDWHAKDALMTFCFDAAAALSEIGDKDLARPLLKSGWDAAMRQHGRQDLIGRYPDLPVLSRSPARASAGDRKFFETFVNARLSRIRLSVKCKFVDGSHHFQFYIVSGSRGLAELHEQFESLKKEWQGEVPEGLRKQFIFWNEVAVAENRDFRDIVNTEYPKWLGRNGK